MAVDFFIKATNVLAVLEFDVTNEDGTAVDCTNASADYRIWSTTPGTDSLLAITPNITIPVATTTNRVRVAWEDPGGTLDVAGRYYGSCDITFISGDPITVPTVGYHQIMVDALGPLT